MLIAGGGLIGGGGGGGAASNNHDTVAVIRSRERHHVVSLEEWIDNSPPSLFQLCIRYLSRNLVPRLSKMRVCSAEETEASNGRNTVILDLNPGIRLDSRTTDALLQYYIDNRLNDDFRISPNMTMPLMRQVIDRTVLSMFINAADRLHLTFADLEEICERDPTSMIDLLRHAPELKFLTVSARKLVTKDFVAALEQSPATLRALSFVHLSGGMSKFMKPTITFSQNEDGAITTAEHKRDSLFPRDKTDSVRYLTIEDSRDDSKVHEDACHILSSFWNLRHLQITSANSIQEFPLLRFEQTLQVLDLHDCKLEASDLVTISNLSELRVLDVSQTEGMLVLDSLCLKLLNDRLTKLAELDISNTSLCDRLHGSDVSDESGFVKSSIDGLKGRKHMLDFLGLYQCRGGPCALPYLPAKRVTGDSSESQTLATLERYMRRGRVIHRALNDVYRILRHDPCTKPFYTLKLILDAMLIHVKSMRIQIAGSAALFYVIKNDLRNVLPVKTKRQVLRTLIDAMQNHAKEQTMLRNGCLTLCQFQIPDDVMFIYEDVVKVLLVMLGQPGLEEFLMRIAVLLLNSLACQVENEHKLLLGKLGTVDVMLDIIKDRLERAPQDLIDTQREIMDVAWSILWNVTDETPDNCRKFFDRDGMRFFLESRKKYPDNAELLRNIMGLLGNVAEVPELRAQLMHDEYLEVFSELLESESDGIEVSYNACGVLAHLCSDGPQAWRAREPSREATLEKMIFHINRWPLKSKRNINYRSFEPILRLIPCERSTASQHWACWALANLTRVSQKCRALRLTHTAAKYCELLEREGGIEKLHIIASDSTVRQDTLRYAKLALKHVEYYKKNVAENLWDIDVDELGPQGEHGSSATEPWSTSSLWTSSASSAAHQASSSLSQFQLINQSVQQQQLSPPNLAPPPPPPAAAAAAAAAAVPAVAAMPPPLPAAVLPAIGWLNLQAVGAPQQPAPPPPAQVHAAADNNVANVDAAAAAAPAAPGAENAVAAGANNDNNLEQDIANALDDDDDVEMQFVLEHLINANQQQLQQYHAEVAQMQNVGADDDDAASSSSGSDESDHGGDDVEFDDDNNDASGDDDADHHMGEAAGGE